MAANTPSLIEFGELSQVQQTVANLARTRKFPFSGVQRNFPQRIVLFDAIIIDAELSQVRNPFVQNQAVAHMDEPSFIEILRQPLEEITQCYGFDLNCLGSALRRAYKSQD